MTPSTLVAHRHNRLVMDACWPLGYPLGTLGGIYRPHPRVSNDRPGKWVT
jgi:hypothetical protein